MTSGWPVPAAGDVPRAPSSAGQPAVGEGEDPSGQESGSGRSLVQGTESSSLLDVGLRPWSSLLSSLDVLLGNRATSPVLVPITKLRDTHRRLGGPSGATADTTTASPSLHVCWPLARAGTFTARQGHGQALRKSAGGYIISEASPGPERPIWVDVAVRRRPVSPGPSVTARKSFHPQGLRL